MNISKKIKLKLTLLDFVIYVLYNKIINNFLLDMELNSISVSSRGGICTFLFFDSCLIKTRRSYGIYLSIRRDN